MPLGKYYCDYCEKQFQDTPAARKRHLQGLQHQRARALWYDSLQEPHGAALIQPDGSLARGVCHHFLRTGMCKFGDSCKYLHPKPESGNPTLAASGSDLGATVNPPSFAASQPSFAGNQTAEGNPFSGNMLGDHTSRGNLPPSLQPPPEGGYPPLPFVDWG